MRVGSSLVVVCDRRPGLVGPPGFHTTAREPKFTGKSAKFRAARRRRGPRQGTGPGQGEIWGKAVHGKIGQAKAGGQSWPKSAWLHQNRPQSAKLKVVAKVGLSVAKVGLAKWVVAKVGETVAKEGCGQSGASRHSSQGDRAEDRRP